MRYGIREISGSASGQAPLSLQVSIRPCRRLGISSGVIVHVAVSAPVSGLSAALAASLASPFKIGAVTSNPPGEPTVARFNFLTTARFQAASCVHCADGLVSEITCECHKAGTTRFYYCHKGQYCHTFDGVCRQ
jgi:hypothetical protein